VTVNGTDARRAGNRFVVEIVLRERETEIVAVSEGSSGRREHRVRVVWDRHSQPRYRFSIDDNSFLPPRHRPEEVRLALRLLLLKMLRELHEKYKAGSC